jgi:hypothetical protein
VEAIKLRPVSLGTRVPLDDVESDVESDVELEEK